MANEQLVVQLEARISDFEKQMKKATATANRQAAAIESRFARMNPKLSALGAGAFEGLARGAAAALIPLLSVGVAVNGAKDALKEFGDIADNSAAAGLDAEFFQGIAYQAKLGGVEIDAISGALATFAKNAGLAAEGKGRMVATLKALDPALLENIRNAATQEQRVKLVADALAKETDASKKAAIATAAFGDSGLKLAAVFAGGAAQIDVMQVRAKELGLIVDRDLIARSDALGDSFDTTTKILDLQMKQALVNLGPILVYLSGLAGGLASQIGQVVDTLSHPLSEQSTGTLEARLKSMQDAAPQVATDGPFKGMFHGNPMAMGADMVPAAMASAQKDQDVILAELRKRAVDNLRSQLTSRPPTTPDLPTLDEIDKRNKAAQAAIDQAAAVKALVSQLDFEQTQVGKTATEQAVANALRQAGAAATEEQRDHIEQVVTATAAEQAAIDASTAAMEKFADVSKEALSTFITDLTSGKSLAESFGDVLSGLGSQLLNAGLDSLFSTDAGSPLASLFLPKREFGGPVSAGQPYIVGEKRPEVFVPSSAGRIVPRLGGMAGAAGGGVYAPVNITIDARGADAAGLARVERQLATMKAELPHTVVGAVRDAKKRRVL